MPNIAQQDYIIIDWEGKNVGDAAKKAEVAAQLTHLFAANPRALLSVIFDHYDDTSCINEHILSCQVSENHELIGVDFYSNSSGSIENIDLS